MRFLRYSIVVALPALVVVVACKREEKPPEYPVAQGYPPPAYPPPTAPAPPTDTAPPATTAPPPATTAPPAPTAPPASGGQAQAGLPCASDADLVCPFGRCISGRCGGCRSDGECKAGSMCVSTPVGNACMPGTAPPPAPPPATTTTTPPTPTTPPPTTTPPAPPAGQYAAARDRCVKRTNEYRATKNLPALSRRTDREPCADDQGKNDSASKTPHGSFGKCGEAAQNECPGWKGTPETTVDACLKAMFDEGPGQGAAHGHYNNMMEPKYKGVACGLFVAGDGSIWLVQDFYR